MKTKFDIENAEVIFNQNGVVGKKILKQGNLEYLYLKFEPYSGTDDHVQENLMTFFIVSGQAKLIIDSKENQVSKGELIEIPAGSNRKWINSGNEILELFVIKTILQ